MPNASSSLTVVSASYPKVQAYSQKHHHDVFNEPSAIAAEKLFAGLDSAKTSALADAAAARTYGYFLKCDDQLIGWHLSRQVGLLYTMESSGVLPEFQGRGYYKILLDHVVGKAREEGYPAVVSTHAADNNRILIPKLRYGFLIKGFEINPMFGLDVKLIYYFSEGQRKAHALRVGSRADFNAP